MKKSILIATCFTLLAISMINIACSKEDEWEGCRCVTKYQPYPDNISAKVLKSEFGINSCSEAQAKLRLIYDDVLCTDL